MPDPVPTDLELASAHKRRLTDALRDAGMWQRLVLEETLVANAHTIFGRKHGFDRIGGVNDFRRAVPIRSYTALAPWITRAAAGESNVLTREDPLVFFTSSGSTGTHKKVPITRGFIHRVYLPFLLATHASVFERCRDVLTRDDATLSLKHDPGAKRALTASGRPHIGASQLDLAEIGNGAYEPGTRAPWSALPSDLEESDPLARLYHRVRVAAEHDVRCIVGINPAQVAALPWLLERWWPTIAREVRDGTLGGKRRMTPNPMRAQQLERMAAWFGTLLPAHLWPHAQVIVCWNTGLASLYMPRLQQTFGPHIRVYPAPVAASEGPIGVPLDEHPTAGPLAVASVFYEFVPADLPLRPDGETLLFDELQEGSEYHVLLTHVGGFYRYAVGDIVRVVGSVAGVPRVEYAGRNVTVSAAGVRLRESHLVRALRAACLDAGVEIVNATSRVAPGTAPQRWEVALAPHHMPVTGQLYALERAVERHLTRLVPAYRSERISGALDSIQVHATAPDAFLREWERRVRAGNRPPQVKDRVFWSDDDSWNRLIASAQYDTVADGQYTGRGERSINDPGLGSRSTHVSANV